jgi:hypothetical protein
MLTVMAWSSSSQSQAAQVFSFMGFSDVDPSSGRHQETIAAARPLSESLAFCDWLADRDQALLA